MWKPFFQALQNLFRKPATIPYPYKETYKPPTYRGLIVWNESACIKCRLCEIHCPAGAIAFSQDMEGKLSYHYEPIVCIYCGECVRVCPKREQGALIQSAEPASIKVQAEDPNNSWTKLQKEAQKSREAYAAAKRKAAAEAAAKAQAQKPNTPA